MIRFVLKSALALGLLATVVPLGTGERADGAGVDLFGLAVGVQQAVADLGGFCARAPQACVAARNVATYAGERVEDGVRLGVAYLTDPAGQPTAAGARVVAAPQAPDPVTTGTVEAFPPPRPYVAPKPAAARPPSSEAMLAPAALKVVAVPTPAPRS